MSIMRSSCGRPQTETILLTVDKDWEVFIVISLDQ